MTMIAQRIIAPALVANHHHQQQHQVQNKGPAPVIRFSGSDVNNTGAKRQVYQSTFPSGGPLPSIERRNARERNRVKQVNNGFDKLRQYIPPKMVEVENGGRGVSKKLSKVDTLKYAVRYIQRLKEMLDENNSRLPAATEAQSTTSSLSSTSSYYSASPAPSSHQHPMYVTYASTPLGHYQEQQHHSEPSVSPAPSFHSDVSSHQSLFQLQTAQVAHEEPVYVKGYSHAQFVDEDSGSFEEDGILDDILQWQLQN